MSTMLTRLDETMPMYIAPNAFNQLLEGSTTIRPKLAGRVALREALSPYADGVDFPAIIVSASVHRDGADIPHDKLPDSKPYYRTLRALSDPNLSPVPKQEATPEGRSFVEVVPEALPNLNFIVAAEMLRPAIEKVGKKGLKQRLVALAAGAVVFGAGLAYGIEADPTAGRIAMVAGVVGSGIYAYRNWGSTIREQRKIGERQLNLPPVPLFDIVEK